LCIYIFSSERRELEKTQANIAYYEEKIKEGFTDIRKRRTKDQILEDFKEEKRSIESELEDLSKPGAEDKRRKKRKL